MASPSTAITETTRPLGLGQRLHFGTFGQLRHRLHFGTFDQLRHLGRWAGTERAPSFTISPVGMLATAMDSWTRLRIIATLCMRCAGGGLCRCALATAVARADC